MIPTSKELILLATNDFKNREKRKGLHDQSSWTSGWITGFLSERKPNWSKLREEKVRKEVLDEIEHEALEWLKRIQDNGTCGERCIVGSWLATIRTMREKKV